jgi:hypothetical protein
LQREEIKQGREHRRERTGNRKRKKEDRIGNTWNATGDVVKNVYGRKNGKG